MQWHYFADGFGEPRETSLSPIIDARRPSSAAAALLLSYDSPVYKSLKAAMLKRTLSRKDAKLILAEARGKYVEHEHLSGFKDIVEVEGVSWHAMTDVSFAPWSVMHQPTVYGSGNYITSTGLILPATKWQLSRPDTASPLIKAAAI